MATTWLPKALLQRLERAEEVGPLAIEHVDVDQARQALPVSALPEAIGVDLHSHHPVDDDHRGVRDA